MKLRHLVVPFILLATATACSRDAEVMAFVEENDQTVQAIKAAKSADEARKAWDEHKESLKTKLQSVSDVRGFQVEGDTMDKFGSSLMKGGTDVCLLELEHMFDPDKGAGYKSICDEYTANLKI